MTKISEIDSNVNESTKFNISFDYSNDNARNKEQKGYESFHVNKFKKSLAPLEIKEARGEFYDDAIYLLLTFTYGFQTRLEIKNGKLTKFQISNFKLMKDAVINYLGVAEKAFKTFDPDTASYAEFCTDIFEDWLVE